MSNRQENCGAKLNFLRNLSCLLVLLLLAFGLLPAAAQEPTVLRMGTGAPGGTFFPIGGTLAIALSAPHGSKACDLGGACGVPGVVVMAHSTPASVYNNDAIQRGLFDIGLSSKNTTHDMYHGVGKFAGQPHSKLRVVASLNASFLHLVLPKNSDIRGVEQLRGKRVGIRQSGSATQLAVLQILQAWGIGRNDISSVELNIHQNALALAEDQLDAFFYTVAWPSSSIAELARSRGMKLHSISEAELETIQAVLPLYTRAHIPPGAYQGVEQPVATLSMSSLLVVSADLREDLVFQLTEALWNDNTRNLIDRAHASGKTIRLQSALSGVPELNLPLHPGAERYYRQAGLLK